MIRALVVGLVTLLLSGAAAAHEVRPAYLEIRQMADGDYAVKFKQPAVGDLALPLRPRLSNGWLDGPARQTSITPGHVTRIWAVPASRGDELDGSTLTIAGLENSITDVLVRIEPLRSETSTLILTSGAPAAVLSIAPQRERQAGASGYLAIGFRHIIEGYDHLAFVLGLVLLIGMRWRLLGAVTAFTAAHSCTLAASVLGVVRFHPAQIEMLVALSIVFVAVEALRASRGETSLAIRQPWSIAFLFGLLHGFAFAGALADIGLPHDAVAPALLFFNLGVEAGQLAFVGLLAAVASLARLRVTSIRSSGAASACCSYFVGGLGAFWTIERSMTALGAGL